MDSEEELVTKNDSQNTDNSTYEVIKTRLMKQGAQLTERISQLNEVRKEAFGTIETKLIGSDSIITEHNCVPRDMAPVDDFFIFGYNVHIGLKSKVELDDVFTIHKYSDKKFTKQNLDLIRDPDFIKDFEELYTYYKNTFFAKFTIIEPYFYMIFQTGKDATDIRAFKWEIRDNKLKYVDSRSEHEVKFNFRNEFEYTEATRDDQINGKYPKISILDKLFIAVDRGNLLLKVEDNTEDGKDILSEPVTEQDQTLDDMDIGYAASEQMIILKIRPYKEEAYRYYIYNVKLQTVARIDAIKDTCVLLPGHQGLIFPKGYYLQTGDYKVFDIDEDQSIFDTRVSSVNGEDYQYIFYSINLGQYQVYTYNVIEQKINTPIICNGYSHFESGEMIVFKSENEARKNHLIQIWQTPYVGKNYVVTSDNDLEVVKIGNKAIVGAMADCTGICKLIEKKESYQCVYIDIVKECERAMDTYFWLDKKETFNLKEVLLAIKETATFAVGEFEKVLRMKVATKKQLEDTSKKTEELLKNIQYGSLDTIDDYVSLLANIRSIRGEIATLRDLRYVDLNVVAQLDGEVKVKYEEFSKKCIEFLLQEQGLKPYETKLKELQGQVDTVTKSKDGKELEEKMNETSGDLELLIDIISNFNIEDPTKTTEIIEKISALFSVVNNDKARLKNRINDLVKNEMMTQFQSQIKLLSQSVVNYIDISDSVEKCDEYCNKTMILIQELEGKFAEFDEYISILAEKREELYNAFESKKQLILERENKKTIALFNSAERILSGISNRLKNLESVEQISGYLATDILVEKVRDIITKLTSLGNTVKADEVSSRLKKLKEEAIRQLKDRQELYLNGDQVIQLGRHHFSVNKTLIDLSIVQKENQFFYHITGTDFWEPVQLSGIEKFEHVLDQTIVSENSSVYRSEFLAYSLFEAARQKQFESLEHLTSLTEEALLKVVQTFMESKYQEGYTKGVHDVDATKILRTLLELHRKIDLLTYKYETRAFARLYWKCIASEDTKRLFQIRLKELAKVSKFFDSEPRLSSYLPIMVEKIREETKIRSFLKTIDLKETAEYLCHEIMNGEEFVVSKEAKLIYDAFMSYLKDKNAQNQFQTSMNQCRGDLEGLYYLVQECVNGFKVQIKEADSKMVDPALVVVLKEEEIEGILKEVIALILGKEPLGRVIYMDTKTKISGLVGNHAVIQEGEYILSYTRFMKKLSEFVNTNVSEFNEFQEIKKELISDYKAKIHLEEYRPSVLTSFVRNQLIDKVYLPLIGDNLAKQIGVVGDEKRTDLMGLLLLLSPPGYGKTTLIEYIASRLGIILVKISGPSLGYGVTSLDPAMAPNTGAKEEIQKLNIALKMQNNVMIYIDDIQHCNPEFLQKFISLCDGQRKIDGVYNGVGKTYDLRGKKVAVVMAGNPYTESGEKFKIPDMLANRADVYNLGDMMNENEEAFKLSYIENSLTSNPILSKLSTGNRNDLYGLVKMAEGAERETVTLEGTYSMDEMNDYISVLKKLCKTRDIVLKVNLEYIASAATAEEYRNEPAFKLQGSYRNMNKIAEKVVPIMNDNELFQRIYISYENDSQTLTSGAEANMLKWKEITQCITKEETQRYEEIKRIFLKNKLVHGDDKLGQAVMVLSNLTDHLQEIKEVLAKEK